MKSPQRIIYLIHFHTPFKHAKHYTGSTADLDARLKAHQSGNGSRLMAVISEAGINWTVARAWTGTRKDERRLKNRHDAPRLCPICRRQKRQAA